MPIYFDEEHIENRSWQKERLQNYEFEHCSFSNCDFSEAAIISSSFVDCVFLNCNFSLTSLNNSILNGVRFIQSKLLGIKFNLCNDFIFDAYFEESIVDYSSFEGRKMPKTIFKDCSLKGVDFVNSLLKQARFINCNLDEAVFIGANLQEASFTTSYNYTINLQENFVKKTKFGKGELAGLLRNYDIVIENV